MGLSMSESVPEMLQDALPYPLPVITPIWGPSHGSLFTLSRIVCLLFALGMIALDISGVKEGGGEREKGGQRRQKTLYQATSSSSSYSPPALRTQNLPNPLTANEHSCSLGRGDLNSFLL